MIDSKRILAFVLAVSWGLAVVAAPPTARAAMDPSTAETRVQADLDTALSRVLQKDSYLVHVTSTVDTLSERKLLEGETITQNQPKNDIVVPPLPGFELPKPSVEALQPPGQSRQVFKTVEKDVLKSLSVQVTYDQALGAEQVAQAKELVDQYLAMNFGSKARASFSGIHMLAPAGRSPWESPWLPWAVVSLLGLALAALFFRRARPKPPMAYPSVLPSEEEEATVVRGPGGHPQGPGFLPRDSRPLALPSGSSVKPGKFPALPATRDFVDRRSELLESFLKSSDTFRLYFLKLPEAAQLELYAALRGPAFDSLLETLEIVIPPGGDTTAPPTEEQMLFYLKNFTEFLQTQSWQTSQFFGFLRQLSADQIVTLVQQENPMVGALMLKFMKPDQSAKVLSALSSTDRQNILGQFSRIAGIATQELVSIEEAVREHVTRLPKFMLGYSTDDLGFWTKILSQADNQDEILGDLEKSRPELYPKLARFRFRLEDLPSLPHPLILARFRFRLEDLPSLPHPLISQVLGDVDNDELALALASVSRDVAAFVLAELPANRRALLSSQITMVSGLPPDRLTHARQALTMRFREVMA